MDARIGKKTVGRAYAWMDSRGEFVILGVGVSGPFRRRGVATAMYRALEQKSGRQLKPAISLSDAAFEFWKRYRPEAVADDLRHRPELIGRKAHKAGRIGTITKASGRVATLVFDDCPAGTWSALHANDLEAALLPVEPCPGC